MYCFSPFSFVNFTKCGSVLSWVGLKEATVYIFGGNVYYVGKFHNSYFKKYHILLSSLSPLHEFTIKVCTQAWVLIHVTRFFYMTIFTLGKHWKLLLIDSVVIKKDTEPQFNGIVCSHWEVIGHQQSVPTMCR